MELVAKRHTCPFYTHVFNGEMICLAHQGAIAYANFALEESHLLGKTREQQVNDVIKVLWRGYDV